MAKRLEAAFSPDHADRPETCKASGVYCNIDKAKKQKQKQKQPTNQPNKQTNEQTNKNQKQKQKTKHTHTPTHLPHTHPTHTKQQQQK